MPRRRCAKAPAAWPSSPKTSTRRGCSKNSSQIARERHLLVGDTGVASETKVAVGAVRAAWEREPQRHERIFDEIGALVSQARDAIEFGHVESLGPLLNRNQDRLCALGVSTPM